MSGVVCVACGDTGLDSHGKPCRPCAVHGRQPLRDAVLAAVQEVFDDCATGSHLQPSCKRVIAAVNWAYRPKVQYAIGFRCQDGDMDMCHGPTMDLGAMIASRPQEDQAGRTAYIVRMVKGTLFGEPTIEPVARWHNGHWQHKKKA